VDQYGDYLYSFALYRVQDESTAQELVQEALTSALGSKDNFKGISTEKTWLTSILKHKITDFIRKKYRELNVVENSIESEPMEDQFDCNGRWINGPKEWAANPENLLEQKLFLDVVKKCFQSLPEKPSRALTLKELEGETTQEICKVLNITATNCWVILHRARALMRKCIETNWLEKRD
jgi:RNA polymerase sigma-70 factor (ECF subfamily)